MAVNDLATNVVHAMQILENTKNAVVSKGQTWPQGTPYAQLPSKVSAISVGTGGGGEDPAIGFVPTEWNAAGYITKGKWVGGGTIPNYYFEGGRTGFPNLTELIDQDGVTVTGNGTFLNNGAIKEVKFLFATNIYNSFSNCSSLARAEFGLVNTIAAATFTGCSKLEVLILRKASVTALDSAAVFNGTPIASGTGYIYVPATLVDAYKEASNWSTYADQIRAIEDYPEITGG